MCLRKHYSKCPEAGPELKPQSYWQKRKGLRYYKVALELARKHCPKGMAVLDIGGADCEYISWFDWFPFKTRIDISPVASLCGAETIQSNFMDYHPRKQFDLVLCLQVLEHLASPVEFCNKLIKTGRILIISVPYRWPKGRCKSHVNDPIDEERLERWLGGNWRDKRIVRDRKWDRLVVVI